MPSIVSGTLPNVCEPRGTTRQGYVAAFSHADERDW
jgi:hypothetical protein